MIKLSTLGSLALSLTASSAFAEAEINFRALALAGGVQVGPESANISVPATTRLAYVIGNNDYAHVTDLKNARRDAQRVAKYFRGEGYVVSEHIDVDKNEFEALLRKIARETDESTDVVFYFAGHGIQIGDSNYLIPTDAQLESFAEVALEAVSLANVMRIAKSRSRTLVVFLDSCRNNPFEGRELFSRLAGSGSSAESGFVAQQAPINSFLSFSTSPGMLAFDGKGENSPFTEALVEVALESRSEKIQDIMQDVRRRVYDVTAQRQLPWESTSLVDDFYLSNPDLAEPLVLYAESDAEPQPDRIVKIDVELQDTVNIGDAISTALGTQPNLQLAVLELPRLGRIESETGLAGQSIVAYKPSIDSLPALKAPNIDGAPTIDDNFVVSVANQIVQVQMSSEINACDFEAGDHLDAEGVGVARYPNELRPEAALDACLRAVAENPNVGRFQYQLGRAYLALRDIDNAEVAFEAARKLGHDRAFYALGTTTLGRIQEVSGKLRELAPAEVLGYYAAGAERGDPYAIHALGRQYLLFSDDPVRQDEGFRLLTRAAEMGHTFAMNALGSFFLDEDRSEFDPKRGLEFWKASAARNDIYGLANMGTVYRKGLGGENKDLARALEFYKAASDGGHPTAPNNVGLAYLRGDGTAVSAKDALEFFDLAMSRGNGWGGANGAKIFAEGQLNGNLGDAAQRSAKAIHLNSRRAAERAEEQLAEMSSREIDAASQAIMNQLGASLTVDGAFGPGSRGAVADLESQFSVTISGDAKGRLLDLAKLYWQKNKLRVDLY